MNIFFLSRKPGQCARWHYDKHVVKMILESTQILYTVNHVHGGTRHILESAPLCSSSGNRGYKMHAKNHPSVRWATESLTHYEWLIELALNLAKEYQHRFGFGRVHACYEHIMWLKNYKNDAIVDRGWLRDPPPAMPDEIRNQYTSSVLAYRAYYNGPKKYMLKYTNRHVPHWLECE